MENGCDVEIHICVFGEQCEEQGVLDLYDLIESAVYQNERDLDMGVEFILLHERLIDQNGVEPVGGMETGREGKQLNGMVLAG